MKNTSGYLHSLLPVIGVVLAAFILAFMARAYRLEEIHYKFDEWLGTLQAGPPVPMDDGLLAIAKQIHATSQYYVMSTLTITTCVLQQVLKLVTGPDMAAMRWWFITIASLGVALTGWVGIRLFRHRLSAVAAVILMGSFSVCAIIFSQFANNFAFTYLMTVAQVAIYLALVRPAWRWSGFLLFAVTAYLCQLVMYTQLLITAGLFLAALLEIIFTGRSVRRYIYWFFAGIIYGALSFLHFFDMFSRVPWDEPFRIYMAPYYPLALLEKGPALTGWDTTWVGYYFLRIYDLFNYHWSLVFDLGIYQPLEWNWVSVPFLVVLIFGIGCGVIIWWEGRGGREGKQLAVSSKRLKKEGNQLSVISNQSGKDDKRLAVSGKRFLAIGVVPLIFCSVLVVHMLANWTLLITFGGTRQCVYMAPLFWLFYGWLVYNILNLVQRRGGFLLRPVAVLLVLLPVVPFLISLPNLYRDRIGRADMDLIAEAIERYQPEQIISPRDSIQGIQLTMIDDPRFTEVHWPGYPYESDILDADPVIDRPGVAFIFDGEEYVIDLVSPENFPRESENLLYIDLYMSSDSRYEDQQLKQFYRPLANIISKDQRIIPLAEKPGNAPKAVHQSIYWPPNSFYLYRVIKDDDNLKNTNHKKVQEGVLE